MRCARDTRKRNRKRYFRRAVCWRHQQSAQRRQRTIMPAARYVVYAIEGCPEGAGPFTARCYYRRVDVLFISFCFAHRRHYFSPIFR